MNQSQNKPYHTEIARIVTRLIPIASLSLILLFSPTASYAQTRMHEMQERIESLEFKVAALEAKITRLNELLEKSLQQQARNSNPTSKPPTSGGSTKPPKNKPPVKVLPPKPKLPKRISSTIKTYRSAEDILQDLPSSLKPQNGTWSSSALSELKAWLPEALKGQKLKCKLTISRSQITDNPENFDNPLAPQWIIKFYTDRTEMKMGDMKLRQVVTGENGTPIQYLGDNELADKVRVAKGKSLEVIGEIQRMQIGPKIGSYREIRLQLSSYKLSSPTLPFK